MSYLSSFTNRENIGLEQFKWLPESKYHLLEAHLYLLIVERYNWNQSLEAEIGQIQVRHCADIFNAENAWFDTKVKWMNWMYMWSQTSFNTAFSFNFCEYLKNREKSSLM